MSEKPTSERDVRFASNHVLNSEATKSFATEFAHRADMAWSARVLRILTTTDIHVLPNTSGFHISWPPPIASPISTLK